METFISNTTAVSFTFAFLGSRHLESFSCSYYAHIGLIDSDDMFDVNAASLMNDYEMTSFFPLLTSVKKIYNHNRYRSKMGTPLQTRLDLKFVIHVTREFGKMNIRDVQTTVTIRLLRRVLNVDAATFNIVH